MEEPYEGENTNPEVIEDLYVLKTKIDTSDITKLRRELQQVRYELAQAQSDVRRLRSSSEGSFASVGNVNVSSQLKMELDRVKELKYQQSQIVNQINSGSIRDTEVFTRALGSLNSELENIGKNSRGLDAAITIIEGAMGRMAAVSKKSQDYKQLQESFNSLGIEANIPGGRASLADYQAAVDKVNNTPVTLKFNNQELTATIDQLEIIETLLTRIATQTKQNIVLTQTAANKTISSVITPAAGGSNIAAHAYIPPSYFVERAQAVNRDNAGFTQPARVAMAAFHGTPLLSLDSNQQIKAGTSAVQSRGTSREDVKEILSQAGLIKELPARNQFMTMGSSSFLDVTHIDKLTGVMDKVIAKIDSVILADIRYIGDRYGQRIQLSNRSQMGGVIDGILSDDSVGNMERAYHYQVSKLVSLFNIDWKDTGGSQYWRRGTPSANITEKELSILDLVDQFPGSLKSSEISHGLELGHYQSLNSSVRDLQKKGMLRRAIVPPTPIPEAGINNQIHPAIMALLGADPSLFLQFAMEASPIKFLDTSERGRQVLEMEGMYSNPSRINSGMQLNAMVGNPEDTLVENYKSQMALPPANAWWLRGYNMLNYGDSASGSKLLFHLENILNNMDAFNPEFIKPLLSYIPHSMDARTGRISVNPEAWVGKNSEYQYFPTNAGQYMGARSDINWALRTPYVFIDKLMESIARPNRDLFAKGMLGTDAYLKSVINWASGPQGRGINPQLERYTITPDQATQYFKILFGALKFDTTLGNKQEKFQELYNRQYVPYTQYEKSIIIRASNEMLKRALPISSGMDPGTIELLRSRSFMSKGEGAQVDKMLYAARQDELTQLIRAVPDLQRYFKAFEAYQKSVLDTFNQRVEDIAGIFEESAESLGTTKPVPPEMRRRIANDTFAASSWRKYPEFWDTGWGNSYEETYMNGSPSDPNNVRIALSKINAQSERAALRTKVPAADINKFRVETNKPPYYGFSGILPWNNVLEYYSQYGSQNLNPAGQKEYERLMANPAELMKEIMWDYTYVEGENTKNPQIKNVIMDTYGTVMKKHAMFGWIGKLKNPEALTSLHGINDKYTDLLAPERIDGLVAAHIKEFGMQDMSTDMIRNRITQPIERQASDEILSWSEKYPETDSIRTGEIMNVFKMKPDGSVSKFFEYLPEKVPVEDVIKRMQYDMQKGRMDPGLLEKYARAVASQKTREGTGYSLKDSIESMWRNSGWDYEGMEGLPQLVENQMLFGYARTGMNGSFDFAGKGYTPGADWSNSAVIDALGIDTSMIDDDMLHDMINTNMEFRDEVKHTVMDAMGVGSDKEWNQYIQYASQQVRQRLKRWEHISMSLQPGIDEFNESFTNGYLPTGETFREPYDFGEVQTEFGNITDRSLIDWLKREYYGRQPATPPKGAMTRGIEAAQYAQLQASSGMSRADWDRKDRERMQALGIMRQLPSVSAVSDKDVRQSMYAFSPDWDWNPMQADTSTITYNRGFTMSESPASAMLRQMKEKFGISPYHQPAVKFVTSAPGDAPGYYTLGKNLIEISNSAQDPASVMAHEYMHSVGNERLVHKDNLQNMVDFYQGNNIPMFQHSKNVGEQLKNENFDTIFKSRYLSGLKKKDPEAYARELERIAPFRKLFAGMSSDGVKNFFAMGEEIAIVMEKYHEDYATHVQGLFGNVATDAQKMKVAYVRNLVGIDTEFPSIAQGLPPASADTIRRYSKSNVGLGDMNVLPLFGAGVGGQAMGNKFEPAAGLSEEMFPGRERMPWYDRIVNNLLWTRDARQRSWMSSLPDASMTVPGRLVKARGEEVPFTYQMTGAQAGGTMNIYKEYARFNEWLQKQGYDTSKIKQDVTLQRSADGTINNALGMMSGTIRIPDSIRRGRTTAAIIEEVSNEAGQGYRSFNDQAARYEDIMEKMPKWTDSFTKHGKAIAGVSWQFTTLQMAALGIFFSMMSLVSVMGQGLGMIVGGVGDLEGMLKAKAMAGMSGQFTYTDENGNVNPLTGQYIDEGLGITDETRKQAWMNLTDFTSTLTTMLSGFGSEVLTHPEFIKSANTFLGKLFDVLKDDKNLESVVGLSKTLFETIGDIVEKLPGLIQLFDKIASLKVPEGVPGIGGQSALSVYGTAALMSLIAMPILAGVTLMTKLAGWTAEAIGIAGGTKTWMAGRAIEKEAIKLGYTPEEAAQFRTAGGIPRMTPSDETFFGRTKGFKIPDVGLPTGTADELVNAGRKFTLEQGRQVADDFAAKGIRAGGTAIEDALAKVAMGIETKAAGLMIFTREDLVLKETLRAERNLALSKNEIPSETGMIGLPGMGPAFDMRTFGSEVAYGQMHMNPILANNPILGPIYKTAQLVMSARHAWDKSVLWGKTAADVKDTYKWKIVDPITGEEKPWTPGMNIPESYMNDPWMNPTEEQKKKSQEKQAAFVGGFVKSMTSDLFTYSDSGVDKLPVEEAKWNDPIRLANGISEDPLNSKWTKDSGATFNQTNNFTTVVPVDQLSQILELNQKMARQLGV